MYPNVINIAIDCVRVMEFDQGINESEIIWNIAGITFCRGRRRRGSQVLQLFLIYIGLKPQGVKNSPLSSAPCGLSPKS